mgnify:CR=1 FL=1
MDSLAESESKRAIIPGLVPVSIITAHLVASAPGVIFEKPPDTAEYAMPS